MKDFETISEKEILNAVYFYFLEKYNNEYERLEKLPNNWLIQFRFDKIKVKYDEITKRLFEFEKQNKF